MATPIVIHPQDKSPIIIKGGDKGSAIRVDDSINWNRVEAIVTDAVRDAVKNVSVDSALSNTSTNAVENRVITNELNNMKAQTKKNKNLIYAAL